MNMFRLAGALLLAALAACASVTGQPPERAFYVMRHLEKAPGPDPALSDEGRRNAALLANWFQRERPSAIYVSTTRRARETAASLAGRLRMTPREYDPSDTAALVAQVRAERGTVLIVGHSNTVPDIVAALGGVRPAPLAETEYGDIWRISAADGGVTRLRLTAR
jgi:broad specificity phosphatase PhoE